LDLSSAGRFFISGIVKKRADGCQSQIAAADGNPTILLQVIEKGSNQWRIHLFKGQLGRRLMQPLLSELQKQAKRVPIRTDGVRTGLPLIHQTLGKEALQQPSQRTCGLHDCFSQ
jgi:hypothetical protein